MEQPLFDDRPPVWQRSELWSRAAVSDRLFPPAENKAVQLTSEDPVIRGLPNCYTVWLGPQSLLHGFGSVTFDEIRRELQFDAFHEWDGQKQWLESIFRNFFSEGSSGVGSVSFRRSDDLRTGERSRIQRSRSPNVEQRFLF